MIVMPVHIKINEHEQQQRLEYVSWAGRDLGYLVLNCLIQKMVPATVFYRLGFIVWIGVLIYTYFRQAANVERLQLNEHFLGANRWPPSAKYVTESAESYGNEDDPQFFAIEDELVGLQDILDPEESSHRNNLLVIGIIVKRSPHEASSDSLQDRLGNLLSDTSCGLAQGQPCLFVLLVSERDPEVASEILDHVEDKYSELIDAGSLEIILPGEDIQIEDDAETDSRSEESLETMQCVHLMSYAKTTGVYYLHLTSDVIAAPDYLQRTIQFLQAVNHSMWISLDVQIPTGVVGSLVRTVEIPAITRHLYRHRKEVLSLADQFQCYVDSVYEPCFMEQMHKDFRAQCVQEYGFARMEHFPPLIRLGAPRVDLGLPQSGLRGMKPTEYTNPSAKITTNLIPTSNITVHDVYRNRRRARHTFTAQAPKGEVFIHFRFLKAIAIKEFQFRFYDKIKRKFWFSGGTLIEVFPLFPELAHSKVAMQNTTVPISNGFYQVGEVSETGVARGLISSSFGKIVSLRLRMTRDQSEPMKIVLSKILLKVRLLPSDVNICNSDVK